LWYFITAIVASMLIFFQQYFLIHTAETLTGKLRSMMFRGILRQDIAFFDEDKNSTGALTSKLADQPQKVQGLAGVTLGTIVQSISTIVTGMIIGLIYGPKLAAIGTSDFTRVFACSCSSRYRMHSPARVCWLYSIEGECPRTAL
jgi:ATP-binding cassette subfamily B (MDR/TAP) protein 1